MAYEQESERGHEDMGKKLDITIERWSWADRYVMVPMAKH